MCYNVDMDQASVLRKLSGETRLSQALRLSDFVRELALININGDKHLSRKQAIKELRERIEGDRKSYARLRGDVEGAERQVRRRISICTG